MPSADQAANKNYVVTSLPIEGISGQRRFVVQSQDLYCSLLAFGRSTFPNLKDRDHNINFLVFIDVDDLLSLSFLHLELLSDCLGPILK